MGWWPFRRAGGRADPPDYYTEGLRLADRGRYHEALTSFRLALRARPDDPEILQQMALVYTQIGMPDEAVRFYTEALETGGDVPGAHYGLAFLLLQRGEAETAKVHLRAFLDAPPEGADVESHVAHARRTLGRLEAPDGADDVEARSEAEE